jgi:hypothetical protein
MGCVCPGPEGIDAPARAGAAGGIAVKELDFLPEWYKDDRRRHVHVRRQYVALAVVFFVMMVFNATATHRASRAAAHVANLENQRVCAEAVVQEFDGLTRKVNDLKAQANLVEQMDSRVDIAAILAEMSHVIGGSIVLRKVEIAAEPFARADEKAQGSVVRLAGTTAHGEEGNALGPVKFRIVLTGVAAHPAEVADLVCKLDESQYFQQVHPSFYGNARVQVGARTTPGSPDGRAAKTPGALEMTEFEIVCYLANYGEMQ